MINILHKMEDICVHKIKLVSISLFISTCTLNFTCSAQNWTLSYINTNCPYLYLILYIPIRFCLCFPNFLYTDNFFSILTHFLYNYPFSLYLPDFVPTYLFFFVFTRFTFFFHRIWIEYIFQFLVLVCYLHNISRTSILLLFHKQISLHRL